MPPPDQPAAEKLAPWIVCHRRSDSVEHELCAFSTEDRAYLHAARLIRDELSALLEFAQDLDRTLREGRYLVALQLYHQIADNLDTIEVSRIELDQFHSDEPLDKPTG
jgi:hypothetical protein